ncbi:MAG: hypothetical protein Hyperionvirus3_177 [Hyperionvirus sp.]|uniref:Uncharacterized protein n=1 Tax=Hyperionvirus sp. TaxID=2487770 RepID=A0A3G5AA07_9VIRU|nr:MAG: hypothetical protein Hyperionvirus3_177 [Hyperionvirus sp.]
MGGGSVDKTNPDGESKDHNMNSFGRLFSQKTIGCILNYKIVRRLRIDNIYVFMAVLLGLFATILGIGAALAYNASLYKPAPTDLFDRNCVETTNLEQYLSQSKYHWKSHANYPQNRRFSNLIKIFFSLKIYNSSYVKRVLDLFEYHRNGFVTTQMFDYFKSDYFDIDYAALNDNNEQIKSVMMFHNMLDMVYSKQETQVVSELLKRPPSQRILDLIIKYGRGLQLKEYSMYAGKPSWVKALFDNGMIHRGFIDCFLEKILENDVTEDYIEAVIVSFLKLDDSVNTRKTLCLMLLRRYIVSGNVSNSALGQIVKLGIKLSMDEIKDIRVFAYDQSPKADGTWLHLKNNYPDFVLVNWTPPTDYRQHDLLKFNGVFEIDNVWLAVPRDSESIKIGVLTDSAGYKYKMNVALDNISFNWDKLGENLPCDLQLRFDGPYSENVYDTPLKKIFADRGLEISLRKVLDWYETTGTLKSSDPVVDYKILVSGGPPNKWKLTVSLTMRINSSNFLY